MEGDLQVVVGRNLKRIRKQLGHSQETFGDDIQWHRTFVGAVERGERNLTMKTVERLSEQLGVHPLDLLWDQEGVALVLGDDDRAHFVTRKRPKPAPDARAADRPRTKGSRGADPSRPTSTDEPRRRPRPRPS